MEEAPQLDEGTIATLKMIHNELELEDAVEEDINWEDMKPMAVDPVDLILERVNSFKDRIYKKFRKSKLSEEEIVTGRAKGEQLVVNNAYSHTFLTEGGKGVANFQNVFNFISVIHPSGLWKIKTLLSI